MKKIFGILILNVFFSTVSFWPSRANVMPASSLSKWVTLIPIVLYLSSVINPVSYDGTLIPRYKLPVEAPVRCLADVPSCRHRGISHTILGLSLLPKSPEFPQGQC